MSLIDLDHQTVQHKIGSDQTAQNFSINFVIAIHTEAFLIWWFTNKIKNQICGPVIKSLSAY